MTPEEFEKMKSSIEHVIDAFNALSPVTQRAILTAGQLAEAVKYGKGETA